MSPSEETNGRPVAPADKASSSLPFGQQVALGSISGPTYVTAQLLVQQVAYLLSDKIFSYSAPTFDLDLAVRAWAEAKERNIRGEQTDVIQLQTRTGAGALALGYMFSPDFDMAKRHVPQTLLAPSLSLNNLRSSLDQLSLLYGVASPFVAHVAALDYDARDGLLSEYDTALRTAEELGLGLVASASAAETQHMALFATLMAAVLPTIHIYDGVRLARETSRVVDALSKAGVADLFNKLTTGSPAAEERHAISSKVVNLLSLVNRELGDGSDNEANHTALLATLMTALTPSLGVDEGVRLAKETIKASDALSRRGVAETYKKISTEVATLNKRLDDPGKVVELLKLFNNELGTAYDLFEYHGHAAAETVLVVFGSVEAQLAKQVAARLAADGHRVGAVNVRVYRPFVEEAFLKTLPASARRIAVLGQVRDEVAVADLSAQSALYTDVLTSVSFSSKKWRHEEPEVSDVKYAASAPLTPQAVADIFARAADPAAEPKPFPSLVQAQQYTFWDVDESASVASPTVIGHLLSRESTSNVYVSESYDNLVQGGIVRTDIRSSKKSIEAPYAVEEADVVAVGDEKLLKDVDILRSVKEGGKLVLRAPKWKEEGDLEKRVPLFARKAIADKRVELFILDPAQSAVFEENPVAAKSLFEFAFLRVARSDISAEQAARVVLGTNSPSLEQIKEALETTLKQVSVSAEAAEVPADYTWPELRANVKANSFAPFEKTEAEEESRLSDWQTAAKGLAFKEAYGTETTLRPDLSVRTHTITVKENRRLTPETYDRNIFHIEFDLGDSGVTYKIGEALGIHAENDEEEVRAFIEWYGLDADEVVQVPSREDPEVLDTRTVFQALKQNVDVLGKPAKRFYEALSAFATDEDQRKKLATLAAPEGTAELKRRTDVDTLTYVDVLQEFSSARPSFHDLVRIVAPLKRREYSIASAQAVTPNAVALMIVVVDWVDPRGRTRWGHASRYLSQLAVGSRVTVSVKPSVMKLPASPKAPLIMAGLGTGLAPFRAFVQYRAMQKAQGEDIGAILLYLGSRHQREEYLYGEEWEAYVAAGVITHIGAAFSRDQPEKIYIQDRMRESQKAIAKAYVEEEGSFYLCGPTWPVPDVTDAIKGAIEYEANRTGKKVNAKRQIEENKEAGRFVLEVY